MDKSRHKLLVKGIDDRIVIKAPDCSADALLQLFQEYIQTNEDFLQGAKIVLDLGQNQIKSNDLFTLKSLLLDSKLSIYRLITEDEQTRNSSKLLGIPTADEHKIITESSKEKEVLQNPDLSIFVNKTIRSGNVVNSAGHLTIIGDVNPGAVISAVGNIIVWGKLKGEARAGIHGDRSKMICALEISATNLSIADIHWQNNRKLKGKLAPESAQIVEGEIKILTWK